MDFNYINNIYIPEGSVSKITDSQGFILWNKQGVQPDYLTLPKPNDNEIYYTTDSPKNRIYNPNMSYTSNSILSNTYENGIGKIVFKNKLTSIWKEAFDWYSNHIENSAQLSLVRLPDTITYIGYQAFKDHESLTSINIPYGVTYIDIGAFDNCGFTSIDIPNTVNYLYGSTFAVCESLTKLILPDSVKTIGDGICFGCSNLRYVRLSENLTSLGLQSFSACDNLQNIVIPNKVKLLGDECFRGCENLESITLPSTLETVGQSCFQMCEKLSLITCKALTAPSLGLWAFAYINSENLDTRILRVPQNAEGYDTWLNQLGEGWTIEYITE